MFQYISCYGSIQNVSIIDRHRILFQYISCYGSIYIRISPVGENVLFQYISCYGSMFKGELLRRQDALFQYISCYGSIRMLCGERTRIEVSIHLMLWFNIKCMTPEIGYGSFNTSHVMVQ